MAKNTTGFYVWHPRTTNKGVQKRDERSEMALRVRILNCRHVLDAIQRVEDEFGVDQAPLFGPVDLTRNPLRVYTYRIGKAYLTPPAVDDLDPALVALIGDATARATVDRYAAIGAVPMPTQMVVVAADDLRYRLGCNYCGTLIGWSPRSERPYHQVITPDDLDVEFASDDPLDPTVIRHYRRRPVAGVEADVVEHYDLTDLSHPVYRITRGEQDVTATVMETLPPGTLVDGWSPLWRYSDGRPYHRIVISGDPREPYRGLEMTEGTLATAASYTHWRGSIRDAGHPQRCIRGMTIAGQDSIVDEGQGIPAYPTSLLQFVDIDPERPGTWFQFQPGYDPEVTGRSIRTHEMGLVETMGLPVDYERTGGEPTATEAAALLETIQATYPECRRRDSEVLRRTAATVNRASGSAYSEAPYQIAYREEVAEALGQARATADAAAADAMKQRKEAPDDAGRRDEMAEDRGEDRVTDGPDTEGGSAE